MEHKPDIFILTDTKSDGHTIRTSWDWREYQIQESKGKPSGWYSVRHAGVLIGVRNHLMMISGHTEVLGFNHRLAHVTLKIAIDRRPTLLRIIGIYAPSIALREGQDGMTENLAFFQALREWLRTTIKDGEHWIMGGDYNVSTRICERGITHNERDAQRRILQAQAYRDILGDLTLDCYDWWETRDDIVIDRDRTRRDWGEHRQTVGMEL
jgi:exonuclease III